MHPQTGYGRPGWLRCEQFGAGMITGWGAHHIDSAHWGMDTEYTGPVEIWGTAEFPTQGLWNVHGAFRTEALYANGVHMIVSGDFPNGIKFIGTKGLDFRVARQRAGDGERSGRQAEGRPPRWASSDPAIITSVIGPDEIHLYESKQPPRQLAGVRAQPRRQPIAPVEVAHRACSACLLHHIAMLRQAAGLYWDPVRERFKNDDEANALLSRPQRPPDVVT